MANGVGSLAPIDGRAAPLSLSHNAIYRAEPDRPSLSVYWWVGGRVRYASVFFRGVLR